MSDRPRRLDVVFQRYDPPLFFVIFNTWKRNEIFPNKTVYTALLAFAAKGKERDIALGSFVIMPDHIHLFVGGRNDFVLSQWVRLLKRALSTAMTVPAPHWREGFFDHLVRQSESYAQKWEYVRNNPVRAGLVSKPKDWPWRGEPVVIEGWASF
jgi:putative transposase